MNSFGDQGNLDGRGTGVVGAGLEFADDVFSVLHGKYHNFFTLRLKPADQASLIPRDTEPETNLLLFLILFYTYKSTF